MIQSEDRDIVMRITTLEQQNKTLFKMLEEQNSLLKSLSSLTISTQLAAEKLKSVTLELIDVEKDIQDLKFKPARYWDKVIITAIGVIISVVIAALLAKFNF